MDVKNDFRHARVGDLWAIWDHVVHSITWMVIKKRTRKSENRSNGHSFSFLEGGVQQNGPRVIVPMHTLKVRSHCAKYGELTRAKRGDYLNWIGYVSALLG